jgi:hypothetical protein
MLPWVIDLLKRLPRRLHSDGEEFVFLTPEEKLGSKLIGEIKQRLF